MEQNIHPIVIKLTIPIALLGIIGNSFVIISILRRRSLLTSNYYFYILHLAICDDFWLFLHFVYLIQLHYKIEVVHDPVYCPIFALSVSFSEAGCLAMVTISVLRYRATAHPFKNPVSRRTLKVLCALMYIVSFIISYATVLPYCLGIEDQIWLNVLMGVFIFGFSFFVTLMMAVIYCKIARILFHEKNIFQIPHDQNAFATSFSRQRYRRNRKIFFVCIMTVIFYAIGNVPIAIASYLQQERTHASPVFFDISRFLRIVTTHAINPFIYGFLDRKLMKFWKNCRKRR